MEMMMLIKEIINLKSNLDHDTYRYVVIAFLVTIHIALIPGLYIAIQIGRPRFLGLAFYLVTCIVLFDLLYFSTKTSDQRTFVMGRWPASVLLNWRTSVTILFATIAVLAAFGRGVPLYASLTIMFTLLLLRALAGPERCRPAITIALTVAASSVLVTSQVFTVAFYVSTTDTIKHVAIIKNIVEAGGLEAFETTRFDGFLVFHTLSAMWVRIGGGGVRSLIALLTIVVFQAALVSVILAIRRWTDRWTLALVAGVLIGFNDQFLTWASKVHYQSLSFVLFTVVLLAFAIQRHDRRITVVSILVSVAWIATHHLSFAMALFLGGFPFVVGALMYQTQRQFLLLAVQYLLLVILFLVYWVLVTTKILMPVSWIFLHSPSASAGVDSTQILVSTYESVDVLLEASIPIFLSYIHLAFWLSVTLLGLVGILIIQRSGFTRQDTLLILSAFLPAAVFYFPNPLWVPLRGISTLTRWGIITLPFLIVVPAYGFLQLSENVDIRSIEGMIASVIVVLLVFTTISAGMTSPSLVNIAGYDRFDQKYLSDEDLEGISFVNDYATSEQNIQGTSHTPTYAFYQEWAKNPEIGSDQYLRVKATGPSGRVEISPGLTVFQAQAFREGMVKMRVEVESDYYERTGETNAPLSAESVTWNPTSENVIYSNDETIVHYRKDDSSDQAE